MTLTRAELAQYIDHTLLAADATPADVENLLVDAVNLGTYSVCISPSMLPVRTVSSLKIATVCGFPSGKHKPEVKAAEAARSIADGADEVDMVIDIGLAKAGEWNALRDEIAAVRAEVPAGKILKVIIESAALTDDEIVGACRAAEAAKADFVKTSTGFHAAGGATVHAVALMAQTVGSRLGVKASGGIRTAQAALDMIAAGATRLGVSGSRAVLEGLGSPSATDDQDNGGY